MIRASGPTTDSDPNKYYYLEFINCENNPNTIKLEVQFDKTEQSIFVPALPKPVNFPRFKGWKIVDNSFASSEYQILSDRDTIYTKGQELKIGCMIKNYSNRYDKIFTAIPVIEPAISFSIIWDEF